MNIRHLSLVVCLLVGAFGCSKPGTQTEGGPPKTAKEEDPIRVDSDEERRYAVAAKPFLEAVARGDHAAAYALLSSHATKTATADQFHAAMDKAFEEFGKPIKLGSIYGVYTEREILKGAKHQKGEDDLDRVGNQMEASDAVGEMPDSIPLDIRRASVKGEMVFGKDQDTGDDLHYLLTAVLVEENGQLKVGHYWFRNLGIWD